MPLQVLKQKGWSIHRIWSTDWHRNRKGAVAGLMAAADEAVSRRAAAAGTQLGAASPAAATVPGATAPAAQPVLVEPAPSLDAAIERPTPEPQLLVDSPGEPVTVLQEMPRAAQSSLTAEPYDVARFEADTQGLALHEVPVNVLADWVVRVVAVEGPVHIDEVCRRVVENAGGSKMGSRISDAIREGARAAIRKQRVTVRSGFLRLAGGEGAAQMCQVRDRSELPSASKKIEFVPDEELRLALETVIAESCGIDAEGAMAQAARLLGFTRVTDVVRDRVEPVIAGMVAEGVLQNRGDMLLAVGRGGEQ